MRVLGITIVFGVVFVGICMVASKTVAVQISQQVAADVILQLENNHLQDILTHVDGRDITLTGEVSSQQEIDQAIEIVSHRPGVRVVMSQLSVKGADTQSVLQQNQSTL